MTKQDELTAGLQAELARVNARLAEQPAVWSLNVDELAIYRDGKRFVELDEGNNNDSWREALRAGSEVVRLLNAANGIKGAA